MDSSFFIDKAIVYKLCGTWLAVCASESSRTNARVSTIVDVIHTRSIILTRAAGAQ